MAMNLASDIEYTIITQEAQRLALRDLFGSDAHAPAYTIEATSYAHHPQYQEYLASAGGFEIASRRYGTRLLTFRGLILHRADDLEAIIAQCHRIAYLHSSHGGISRAVIEDTSVEWLAGNYLTIGRLTLAIRLLDPFFLHEESITPLSQSASHDRLTLTYPVLHHANQIDYRLRIVAKNKLFLVPRYSQTTASDAIERADHHAPDVPAYGGESGDKPWLYAWQDQQSIDVIIHSISITNGNQRGELDGSIDQPSLLGRIYNVITIDTREQHITGSIDFEHPQNLYRHRVKGSSFVGALPGQSLKLEILGRELERLSVELVAYRREVY